ncbi:MAG: GNAT family N-acetyltransferase [Anaerolineales bacterium]|nr:GNAT family N-acetyltransferase [Anaerolineales bacterium]
MSPNSERGIRSPRRLPGVSRERAHEEILQTERISIRRLNLADADFVLRLVNEPAFVTNIGDKRLRTLDDARRFIRAGAWTNQEKAGYGQFVLESSAGAVRMGICGLLYRPTLDVTDIGFALLPEFRGQGLALEAAHALKAYGHTTLGIETIAGLTSPDNLASIKVLKRLGMTFVKVVKLSADDPGTALYS